MKFGAVIVADGETKHGTLLPATTAVGSVSAVKRLIGTFQQAGVDPIIVVADHQSFAQVEKHTARMGVLCLSNQELGGRQMIDFAKIGLQYLQNKCDKILIAPINTPLFTADTLDRLMQSDAKIANPVYKKRAGHPLLIANDFVLPILQYQGEGGLRGAIKSSGCAREFIAVEDAGVLCNIASGNHYHEVLRKFNQQSFHPHLKLQLVKEQAFFGPGAAQLLAYIRDTGSVRLACQQMGISYSKAWKMIEVMEQQTETKMVERQQGGKNGGMAYLTAEGTELLEKFKKFERICKKFSQKTFDEIFKPDDD